MVGGTRGRFLRSTKRDSGGTTGTVLDVPLNEIAVELRGRFLTFHIKWNERTVPMSFR